MAAILVTGTGTEVGKTWVTVHLVHELRARGELVAARKPAQSFSDRELGATDAELLAAATGEDSMRVCPASRWYAVPMAPPMAADALGRPPIRIADLAMETDLPPATLTLLEGAGGICSPIADDGDVLDLTRSLGISLAILVADAGLGTISAVRLSVAAAAGLDTLVFLNRFDASVDLHRRNRTWLAEAGYQVAVDLPDLASRVLARVPPSDPG